MFKMLFYAKITLLAIFLSACQSESTVEPAPALNMQLINEVKALNGEAQKLAYNNLNPQEKQYIWQERVNQFLLSPTITPVQRQALHELQREMDVTLFEHTAQSDARIQTLAKTWVGKYQKSFRPGELGIQLTTLSKTTDIQKYYKAARVAESGDCQCHEGSIFACEACNKQTKCKIVPQDCGLFWLSDCNASCIISPKWPPIQEDTPPEF